MTRPLTLAIFALLPHIAWGEGYICAMDMSTGFYFEAGAWHSTKFIPDKNLTVRRSTQADKWVLSELGEQTATSSCSDDFDEAGNLYCGKEFPDEAGVSRVGSYDFRINRKSLRFVIAYLEGYYNAIPGNEADNTPYIAIGKCRPM